MNNVRNPEVEAIAKNLVDIIGRLRVAQQSWNVFDTLDSLQTVLLSLVECLARCSPREARYLERLRNLARDSASIAIELHHLEEFSAYKQLEAKQHEEPGKAPDNLQELIQHKRREREITEELIRDQNSHVPESLSGEVEALTKELLSIASIAYDYRYMRWSSRIKELLRGISFRTARCLAGCPEKDADRLLRLWVHILANLTIAGNMCQAESSLDVLGSMVQEVYPDIGLRCNFCGWDMRECRLDKLD